MSSISPLTPKSNRCSISFSTLKKKFDSPISDRFIPYTISPTIKVETWTENKDKYKLLKKRPTSIHQKMLLSQISSFNSTSKINYLQRNTSYMSFNKPSSRKKSISPVLQLKRAMNAEKEEKNEKIKVKIASKTRKNRQLKPFFCLCTDFSWKYGKINHKNCDNFYTNNLCMRSVREILYGDRDRVRLFECGDKYVKNEYRNEQENEYRNEYMEEYDVVNGLGIDISGEDYEIYCTKFHDKFNFITSDSYGHIILTDIETKKNRLLINNSAYCAVSILEWNNDKNIYFFGFTDGEVKSFDIRENERKYKEKVLFGTHNNGNDAICNMKYSEKNYLLITGGNDEYVTIYDIRNNHILKRYRHNAAVKGLGLNSTENILISGGGHKDKYIKMFDIKKLKIISEIQTQSQITGIEFLDDYNIVASFGGVDNRLISYSLDFDKLKISQISSNNLCENLDDNNSEKIINIFNEENYFEPHNKRIISITKDYMGNYIASYGGGQIKIWKIADIIKKGLYSSLSNPFIR